MVYLGTFAAALFLALGLTGVVREAALRAKIMDVPNCRSLHSVPVPKGGGIAIYFAFVLPAIWVIGRGYPQMLPVIVGGSIILLVGFLDDVWGISPVAKLMAQGLAAAVLVGSGIRIGFFPEALSIPDAFLDGGNHERG